MAIVKKAMKLKTSAQHTLISMGTALISVPVLAHSGHYEKKETEAKTKETKSNSEEKSLNPDQEKSTFSQNQSKTEQKTESHSDQGKSTSSQDQPTETQNQLKTEQKTESHQEQPVTQNQIVTISKIPTVGETVLGLIIVTPFLLYAFKKRIHRSG